jgi:predicted membrane protein
VEATQTSSNYLSNGKLVAGIFFTATGLVLTADNLDLVVAERYLRWWPVVLLVIGAMKLANPGSRVFGTVLTIAGAWILAYNLNWIHFTIFDLWPVILIGIGLMMVGRATGVVPDAKQALDFRNAEGLALFAARNIVNTSQDFRGSRLSAILGGYELDLSGANIAQSPAVIDLFVLWGGVEIHVPESWEVVGEVTPVMAGFEVNTRGAADPAKRLIVRGFVIMGGVEVNNRRKS